MHSLLRAMVAFALCCSMLTGAAMAAETTRVVDTAGGRIVFGAVGSEDRSSVQPRAITFANESNSKYKFFTGQCQPSQGDYLDIVVRNQGNAPIMVTLTVHMGDETIRDARTIQPGAPAYLADVTAPAGKGLDTMFVLEVEPLNTGSNPYYSVFCQQRWK